MSLDFQLQALEIVNGSWAVLCLCIVCIFARYIVGGVHRSPKPWRHTLQREDIRAALALSVYFSGELVTRFWIWYWRFSFNNGATEHAQWVRSTPVVSAFAVVALIGGLMVIRAFTPPGCGNRSWILAATLSIGTAALLAYF